jgi:hemolysin D
MQPHKLPPKRPDTAAPVIQNGKVPVDLVAAPEESGNLALPNRTLKSAKVFDRPVILEQSPTWSRAVIWGMIGVTAFTIIWACLAEIEQAVLVQGKLEPQGAVKDVQPPVNGVVKTLHVRDGQIVKKGERLMSLDPTAAQAQIKSLEAVRTALTQENAFYQAQLSPQQSAVLNNPAIAQQRLPAGLVSLAANRAALIAENQLYQAELTGNKATILNPEQQIRIKLNQAEFDSRVAAASLKVEQLQQQLLQTKTQLASAQNLLKVNQEILQDIEPVAIEGGIARLQLRRQQQEVVRGEGEAMRLAQEQARLRAGIAQAKQELQNTIDLSRKDLSTKMAENSNAIASIDSQFMKVLVENQKQISEIDGQLSQAKQTLTYQELKAPVEGIVFDLQANGPGYVVTASKPVLKIVPKDNLLAKVYITNQDIGFVHSDMVADVRIDSFPFSEYGDIKGQVTWIGSDALPPDPVREFYSFPAKIKLNTQTLDTSGQRIPLQAGMSVSANLKLRKRKVISLVTDLFTRKVETLKFMR